MDQNRRLSLFLCSVCCLILFSACHSRRGVIYRVERGDTLWSLAHVNDVEIEEIQKANPQLNIHQLAVGDKIFLPQVEHVKKTNKAKLNVEQWVPRSAPLPKAKTAQPKRHLIVKNESPTKFQWPYRGTVISTFGKRGLKMHNGIDIQLPAQYPIKAAAPGKVVYVGDDIEGYENLVIVQHENLFFTIYAFLGEFLVHKDQEVKTGEPVAKSRNLKPNSFFHFEIRQVKTSLDPQRHLD